jgi:hypothetical protein
MKNQGKFQAILSFFATGQFRTTLLEAARRVHHV